MGTPPHKIRLGIEWLKLLAQIDSLGDDVPASKFQEPMRKCQSIGDIIVNRNLDGKVAEKEGREDEAIVLYELNVEDRFEGYFPYNRLRIIYSKRKQYDQAVRVCQSYIDTLDELDQLGLSNTTLNEHRQKAVEDINKLKKKTDNLSL